MFTAVSAYQFALFLIKTVSFLVNGGKFRLYEIMKLILECFSGLCRLFFAYFSSSFALVSIDQKDPEMKSQQPCLLEELGLFFFVCVFFLFFW